MKTNSAMKYMLNAVFLGQLSLAVSIASTSAELVAPIPGYGVEELQWEVEISPGQVETLNGTVQEVYSQALVLNPDFQLSAAVQTRRELQRRSHIDCNRFSYANRATIEDGISYLRRLKGAPTNGPGPANCARVSCSWDASIWWCNDCDFQNNYSKTIDGWSWIANSAQAIVNVCHSYGAVEISGQNFEEGNWNTIVRGDKC
ncbi:hypothetical protein PWT90_05274 [Aphanocladium album]|nr:hypothetical protein PWT90_05274 [Aphanocladium album]